ncbi:MAG: glutathione S-transferase family protein [Pseudomonadota bacterium]|nr:glutathione S-transferase family protein [Pseudomonadota bacterium]
MGLLVDGHWQDTWYDTSATGGRFVRKESAFRHTVSDVPGAPHPVEPGRYHLYVAMACPWAHRTLVARALLGLEAALPSSAVAPEMLEHGWSFDEAHPDALFGARHLHEVYTRADPHYTGRVTVPVLWDKVAGTIVNNESSEILRMMNGPLRALAAPTAPLAGHDLYPARLRAEIDALNARIYDTVNNGVYRAGFATTQVAYEEAVVALFDTLDVLEARLAAHRWLVGGTFTECDLRLFTTLLRFDPVYYGHFKCNVHALREYPSLWAYTRAIYQLPGVAETYDLASIKRHYYYSHPSINPYRIVPVGPSIDLGAPHGRGAGV